MQKKTIIQLIYKSQNLREHFEFKFWHDRKTILLLVRNVFYASWSYDKAKKKCAEREKNMPEWTRTMKYFTDADDYIALM